MLETFVAKGEESSSSQEQEITDNSNEKQLNEKTEVREEEATILCELEDERTANQKQFLMSDRTKKVVVYSEPVHYKANGKWKNIDNTLVKEEAEDEEDFSGYINKENDFEVKIADNSESESQVKIQKDNYKLQFKFNSDNKSDKKINKKSKKKNIYKGEKEKLKVNTTSETITYENIEEDTDIDYVVTSTGLKENIIVNKVSNQYKYSFDIETENLILELEDNEIKAKDSESDKIVYVIPVPYMYDADGDISNDVKYDLKEKKEGYTLDIKADKKWINDENRAFPVTIDPAITTATTRAAISSTFVASQLPDEPFYNYKMLLVGRESSVYGKCRTFIKFTLPDLNVGDIVVSAKLNLLQYYVDSYTTSTPDLPIEACMVTGSWNESNLAWNTMPTFDSKPLDYSYMCKNDGVENKLYDITKAVKSWYDGDVANYGIMLRSGKESGTLADAGIYGKYWSEKYNEETDAYPVIELEYRNSKGIEDYYSYTDLDGGEAGTAYVNDYTGNLVFIQEGISTSGEKAPVSVNLIYNSADKTRYNYGSKPYVGKGWKLNIQQTVKSSSSYGLTGDAYNTYPYVYTDEDGTEHYFMKVVDGSTTKYYDEDGLGLELTKTSSSYTITDSQDGKMTFLANGNLSTIKDANGNTITINYDSTNTVIQSVTDGVGRNITVTSSGNYLSKLTDPAGRATSYTITDTKLMSITNPDGTKITYAYENDLLRTTRDLDNYKLTFNYLSAAKGSRIYRVNEYAYDDNDTAILGQSVGFTYAEYNQTKIRTSGKDNSYSTDDDIITEYQFDNYGRLVSTNSATGGKKFGASTATYTAGKANSSASNIKQLNRVSKSATLGGNVNNIVLNHSMERTSNWQFIKNGTVTDSEGYTSGHKYIGNKSLKLGATEMTSGSKLRYRQMFTNTDVVPGKTYTLSAYIKTTGFSTLTEGKYGAGLVVYCYYEDGTSEAFYSDYISKTTDTNINNGWRRETVTFKVPTTATQTSINMLLRDATGYAYFDAVQLEEGNVANKYNLLENGSFENANGTYNYTYDNMTSSDGVVSGGIEGSKGYKVTGDKDNYKWLIQEIPVSGNEEDTYIVSGWAKANSAPEYISDNSSSVIRRFKISVKVTYSDGTSVWKTAAEFNHDVVGWQYASTIIDLSDNNSSTSKTPVKLGIYPRYEYQVNSCIFDNLSVVRDDVPTYTYDSNGNMISVVDNAAQQSSMSYSNNNLMSDTDAKGYAYTYTYDNKHNMTQAKSQRGVMYNYTYNSAGNPTKLVVQNIATSAYDMKLQTDMTYTSDGAYVSTVSDQDGNIVSNTYNEDKGLLTSTTNQKGETTSYTYSDKNDLITKVATTNDTGEEVSNIFGYNKHTLNRITHNGFNYSYEYDEFGNEKEVKVGETTLFSNIYNNNNGELSRINYGNGDYNTYAYDKYGNVSTVGVNGITKLKNYADTSGNIVRNEDLINKLQYNYDYDSTSRLIRSSVIDTSLSQSAQRNIYSTEYGYDLNNNISRIVNKAGNKVLTTQYTYTKDNLNTKVILPSQKTVTYAYDSLSRLSNYEISTTTPLKVSYSYYLSDRNADGEDTYRTTKIESETIGDKVTKYTYDELGNITAIQEKQTGGTYSEKSSYVYDKLGQLVRENNVEENKTRVYNYDNGGNITSINEYAYTIGDLGSVTKTIPYAYTDTNWKDKLTSYDGQTITYDEIGNPISYRGYTMGWTNGRELASLSGNGKTATYTYDASGLRLSKTVNGVKTVYQYEDGKLLYEKKGDIEIHYGYDTNGQPRYIHYVKDNGIYGIGYMVTNSRGDVVAILNDDGDVVARYTYDAWGNILSITDYYGEEVDDVEHIGNLNSLRYRGYYYDDDIGMYYLQSRYYDPEVRRFINADDVSVLEEDQGSIVENNLFAYCLNNPVTLMDNDGKMAIADDAVVFIVVVGVCLYVSICNYNKLYKNKYGYKSRIRFSFSSKKTKTKKTKIKKKTSKQSGKAKADDAPSWAKKEKYDPNKTAAENAKEVLDKKYGKGNWSKGAGNEYSQIKKWLQRSKGYK